MADTKTINFTFAYYVNLLFVKKLNFSWSNIEKVNSRSFKKKHVNEENEWLLHFQAM